MQVYVLTSNLLPITVLTYTNVQIGTLERIPYNIGMSYTYATHNILLESHDQYLSNNAAHRPLSIHGQ